QCILVFFLPLCRDRRPPPSFPTRRSSDLGSSRLSSAIADRVFGRGGCGRTSFNRPYSLREVRGSTSSLRLERRICAPASKVVQADRKSTRLNSSHVSISYAVFCLKKKHDK